MTDVLGGLSAVALCLVVWAVVFAETGLLLGFLLPGDSLLFAAGLLCGTPTGPSPWVMGLGVVVAAIAGDQVGYTLGRTYGRPYAARRGPRMASAVARAEQFYSRYGWFSLVAARFIPWVRTFTPFVAGVAEMPRGAFTSANAVGAVVWGGGLVALGYFAYQVPWLRNVSFVVAGVFIVGSLVGGAIVWWRSRRPA